MAIDTRPLDEASRQLSAASTPHHDMSRVSRSQQVCPPCPPTRWDGGVHGWYQGFMQDTIIASHTCFGGHMDVNC